jgi:hypothetical protein
MTYFYLEGGDDYFTSKYSNPPTRIHDAVTQKTTNDERKMCVNVSIPFNLLLTAFVLTVA